MAHMAPDLVKRFLTAIFGSKDAPGSKKAVGLLLALVFLFIVPVLKRLGVEVTDEEKKYALMLFGLWMASQGIADFGKSAAQVDAQVDAKAATVEVEDDPEPTPDPDAPRAG
jgi:hypothetical protein